ncbi:MAG: hypothetical protein ABI813_11845 [Bacteroidota bacterium]
MKNEQKDNQNKKHKNEAIDSSNNKQPPASDDSSPSHSNTMVGKDGRIGKAHNDAWTNDNNNRNENMNPVRNNKTETEPEIDAPIYDPEKTEKKLPRMEDNKNKK